MLDVSVRVRRTVSTVRRQVRSDVCVRFVTGALLAFLTLAAGSVLPAPARADGRLSVASAYAPHQYTPVSRGATVAVSPMRAGNPRLSEIQELLGQLGYYVGPVDGYMAPATRAAVRSFQSDHNLARTGEADDYLLSALRHVIDREAVRAARFDAPSVPEPVSVSAATAAPAPVPAADPHVNDRLFWQSVADSARAADFMAYLEAFPNGVFAPLAEVRLAHLKTTSSAPVPVPAAPVETGRTVALLIGNQSYAHMPPLQTARNDVRVLGDLLARRFGFEVETLIDASRADMMHALDRLRAELMDEDRLLVYYAGHGRKDVATGQGYWLPVGAQPDARAEWFSNATLTDALKGLRARHVMVIADSCYAGTLTRGVALQGVDGPAARAWLREKTSRTVLTSGGLEPVEDGGADGHSVFAHAVITALSTTEQPLTGQDLYRAVKRPVMLKAAQTPVYADIRHTGHDGGDFVFAPQSDARLAQRQAGSGKIGHALP